MDNNLYNDMDYQDPQLVENLLNSTIVKKRVLIKILTKLEDLLDKQFTETKKAKKYEEEFLKILKILIEKQINKNEFFEEDVIVNSLCDKILEKLMRNFAAKSS